MRPLVAGDAVELERLPQFHQSVRDREMTQLALDVVLGEVNPVHQGCILVLAHTLRFIVASVASGPSRGTVSRRHSRMTGDARHHVPHVLRMIHHDPGRREDSRDIDVTAGAAGYRLTFRPVLEVAQETGGSRDRHVVPLNHL